MKIFEIAFKTKKCGCVPKTGRNCVPDNTEEGPGNCVPKTGGKKEMRRLYVV